MLAAHLTGRDRWLLRMLAEHRVLTTHHLVPLAFPSPRAAQLRLATLSALEVITSFRPLTALGSAPTHWVLAHAGRAVLAAEDGRPPPAANQRERADTIAHSQQLGHQLGVNTCLSALAAHTTNHGGEGKPVAVLDTWWGQARCTRHFGDHARPDAYAQLTHHSLGHSTGGSNRSGFAWFFEYDTGTEPLRQLTAKIAGYRRLTDATAITTPLLFWLPNPTREQHVRHTLTQALARLPEPQRDTMPIVTANPTRPDRAGTRALAVSDWHPSTPTWLPLRSQRAPERRVSLIDLTHLWPPTHTHLTPPEEPTGDHTAHQLTWSQPHTELVGCCDATGEQQGRHGAYGWEPAGRARSTRELAPVAPTPPPPHPSHPVYRHAG